LSVRSCGGHYATASRGAGPTCRSSGRGHRSEIDRLKTTPTEEKAVAHGNLSYFGTHTVSEADKTINYRIERSSFPNQVTGADVKRVATLTGDELKLDNPARTAGVVLVAYPLAEGPSAVAETWPNGFSLIAIRLVVKPPQKALHSDRFQDARPAKEMDSTAARFRTAALRRADTDC
jgi:hypothetical protein